MRLAVSVGGALGVRVAVVVAVAGWVPVIVGFGVGGSVGRRVFVGVKLIVAVARGVAVRTGVNAKLGRGETVLVGA